MTQKGESLMVTYTQYRKGSDPSGENTDTDRWPSPNLWYDSKEWQANHAGQGQNFWDDFTTGIGTGSQWIVTNATAGTAAGIASGAFGGFIALDSASATDDQGVQIQAAATSSGGAFLPTAGTKLVFEARVGIGDTPIATSQIFVGLAEYDATVFNAGANDTANHLGYEMNALTQVGTGGTAGYANFYGEKAGTRNTAAANVGLDVHLFTDSGTTDGESTLFTATNCFVKLGFVVNGVTDCRCYVNGAFTGDIIPTANVPVLPMVPTLCCLSEGTDVVMQCDWVKCWQGEP
jgi:hypothetical protein